MHVWLRTQLDISIIYVRRLPPQGQGPMALAPTVAVELAAMDGDQETLEDSCHLSKPSGNPPPANTGSEVSKNVMDCNEGTVLSSGNVASCSSVQSRLLAAVAPSKAALGSSRSTHGLSSNASSSSVSASSLDSRDTLVEVRSMNGGKVLCIHNTAGAPLAARTSCCPESSSTKSISYYMGSLQASCDCMEN